MYIWYIDRTVNPPRLAGAASAGAAWNNPWQRTGAGGEASVVNYMASDSQNQAPDVWWVKPPTSGWLVPGEPWAGVCASPVTGTASVLPWVSSNRGSWDFSPGAGSCSDWSHARVWPLCAALCPAQGAVRWCGNDPASQRLAGTAPCEPSLDVNDWFQWYQAVWPFICWTCQRHQLKDWWWWPSRWRTRRWCWEAIRSCQAQAQAKGWSQAASWGKRCCPRGPAAEDQGRCSRTILSGVLESWLSVEPLWYRGSCADALPSLRVCKPSRCFECDFVETKFANTTRYRFGIIWLNLLNSSGSPMRLLWSKRFR